MVSGPPSIWGGRRDDPAERPYRWTKTVTQRLMRNKNAAHAVRTRTNCVLIRQAKLTEKGAETLNLSVWKKRGERKEAS